MIVSMKVLMVVIGFSMTPNGLEQVWEFSNEVVPEHCMLMSEIIAGAGKAGAFIVKCTSINKKKN